jgi:radical SAM protein with 4Fe4S-binding SPASM domain
MGPSNSPRKLGALPDPGVDTRILDENPAFCLAAWVNFHVQAEGYVTPCCESRQRLGNINRQSFAEIWNGPEMAEVRRKMLQGERIEACRKCYDKEEVGVESFRQWFNHDARGHLGAALAAGESGAAKPVYWDIRFSNICNFRCRSCWHGASSRWFADAKALHATVGDQAIIQGVEDADGLFDQLDDVLPHVEEIYFAGGEPLLMEEHYRLLDRLVERGLFDVPLRYNTNFSEMRYKDRDLFALWRRFSNVTVSASVDAAGRRGELMRKGFDWQQFLENGRRMKTECPQVRLSTDATVSIFNILHLPELFRELVANDFVPLEEMRLHLLQTPAHYSIRVLPEPVKAEARAALHELERWIAEVAAGKADGAEAVSFQKRQIAETVVYMDEEDRSADLPAFRAMTRRLDALRDEKTAEVFPELAGLLVEEPRPRRSMPRRVLSYALRQYRSRVPAPGP